MRFQPPRARPAGEEVPKGPNNKLAFANVPREVMTHRHSLAHLHHSFSAPSLSELCLRRDKPAGERNGVISSLLFGARLVFIGGSSFH